MKKGRIKSPFCVSFCSLFCSHSGSPSLAFFSLKGFRALQVSRNLADRVRGTQRQSSSSQSPPLLMRRQSDHMTGRRWGEDRLTSSWSGPSQSMAHCQLQAAVYLFAV